MSQTNLMEFLYPTFKFNKKNIRLVELFAGVGSQLMALKKLSKELDFTVEPVAISEIDKYSLKSYEAIHGHLNNLGDIFQLTGEQFPNDIDIMSWSSPCQDFSMAGNRVGFKGNKGSLTFVTLNLLRQLKELNKLPKVLLFENVKGLITEKFMPGFKDMLLELEELGYTNYWQVLNAKHYGVAQNRERVFIVSVIGEHYYEFPKPFKLEKRLKDYLEDEVEEKYYLTDKQINYLENSNFNQLKPSNKIAQTNTGICGTLDTMQGGNRQPLIEVPKATETICLNSKVDGKQPSLQDRVYDANGISTCITTSFLPSILIPENTAKGYSEAYEGDAIQLRQKNANGSHTKSQMAQTLTTSGNDIGVFVENNLRIRKLTPLECWRLMSFKDEDYYKAQSVVSNSQLYKQAGNSIVVDVLYHIFKQLF